MRLFRCLFFAGDICCLLLLSDLTLAILNCSVKRGKCGTCPTWQSFPVNIPVMHRDAESTLRQLAVTGLIGYDACGLVELSKLPDERGHCDPGSESQGSQRSRDLKNSLADHLRLYWQAKLRRRPLCL